VVGWRTILVFAVVPPLLLYAKVNQGRRTLIVLSTPKFIYFDLGNVLLHFDHEIACRQMAAVASTPQVEITPERVREVVFASNLHLEFESGAITAEEFYRAFCEATQTSPDINELALAASDIFRANVPIKPLLGALLAARIPLGILSNTNIWHWQFITDGRYLLFPHAFDATALSFELKALKPDKAIYQRAAELVGHAPEEIFYVDDLAENVAGAREAGFDAVQYTTPRDLAIELRKRGVRMNY